MKRVSFIRALFKNEGFYFLYLFCFLAPVIFWVENDFEWLLWMNKTLWLCLIPALAVIRLYYRYQTGVQVVAKIVGIRASYDYLSNYYLEFTYENENYKIVLDAQRDEEYLGKRCELLINPKKPSKGFMVIATELGQ